MLKRLLLVMALALAAAAPAAAQMPRLKVVATFSILADFVREIGGERIDLVTLVGPNGDAHVYSPSPADARQLAEARLIVANGLGFDGWIVRLAKASGTKAPVVDMAKDTKLGAEQRTPRQGRVHGHGPDPHAWQDVGKARLYVSALRDALAAADPEGKALYDANAAAYDAKLQALDAEIRAAVQRVPERQRKVITSHDAFGHFEGAYGLDFIAPQGVSTEAEASAKDVARIIQQIRREKIPAVFIENVSDPRLVEQIARETGARIGERLYSDALSGPDDPAATYIDMMRHNIRALGAALAS